MGIRGLNRAIFWRISIPILMFAFEAHTPILKADAGAFPSFIAMPGVTARGVAVDKTGNVYVTVEEIRAGLRYMQLRRFTPDGEQTFAFEIGQGTIGGLTTTATGNVYVALAAGTGRGVYRIDQDGQVELLAGTNQIFFANGLAFDDVGNLWVTESVSIGPSGFGQGGIWRIPRGGSAELALRDLLLTGTGVLKQPVPIGANGIAYHQGALFVTNTEKGTVLRMSVGPGGSIEPPEVWTTLAEVPESVLAGNPLPPMGDGIALDVHGNLYIPVLTRSAVVRLDLADKSQETVAVFRVPDTLPLFVKLDFPASIFFGTGMGERTNLFVTNMGTAGFVGSSLVKFDAGVPGWPIH